MNIDKTRVLTEMGIKPLWRLRAPLAVVPIAESPALPLVAELVRAAHASSAPVADVQGVADWADLECALLQHPTCPICKAPVHAVMGAGDRQAEWMFVGEVPSSGVPFSGPTGRLLDAMLEAISLKRGHKVYLANAAKCLSEPEASPESGPCCCSDYLRQQIALVQPKVLVAFGDTALRTLGVDANVAEARGKVWRYAGIAVVASYHPESLLSNPADKARAWEDLCLAMDQIAKA